MPSDPQTSYDRVAADYASYMSDEMDRKPFDRVMLDWLAQKVDGRRPICDMGCGPGQIARYLHSRGINACGVDLSPEMVAQAQRLNPGIPFRHGDMLTLDGIGDGAYGGIAAFYSIIHIAREDIARVLLTLKRVLKPGGAILLAFHLGDETVHMDEWWGHEVNVDFHFYGCEEMKGLLQTAGFNLEEAIERDPYPPEVEHQSRRAYIFARRPDHD
jgi:SAM-dependent methyltransferase